MRTKDIGSELQAYGKGREPSFSTKMANCLHIGIGEMMSKSLCDLDSDAKFESLSDLLDFDLNNLGNNVQDPSNGDKDCSSGENLALKCDFFEKCSDAAPSLTSPKSKR